MAASKRHYTSREQLAVGAGRLEAMGVAWPWRLGVNLHRVDGTGTRLEETALRDASKDIASNADSWESALAHGTAANGVPLDNLWERI